MTRPSLLPVILLALLASSCDLFRSPNATTRFDVGASAVDVYVHDDMLLVAAGDSGLLAFGISKPTVPRELWRANFGRNCRSVIAAGGVSYVGTDSGVVAYTLATGDRTRLYAGGTSQVVTGLASDSTRLYVATPDGVTVFSFTAQEPLRFVPLAGEPTGLARHDSRLFVSLNDWGMSVLNVLAGDSLTLDTLRLGRHGHAESVSYAPGGYCLLSQTGEGTLVFYSPSPDTTRYLICAGGDNAAAATDGVQALSVFCADSSSVSILEITRDGESTSFKLLSGFADFAGFTRRIRYGDNGYFYTASGDAGVYIIREK